MHQRPAEYQPTEHLYGQDDRVLTQLELEGELNRAEPRVLEAGSTVMIQCVGCRNEERSYCARICCTQAIGNALTLKKANPAGEVPRLDAVRKIAGDPIPAPLPVEERVVVKAKKARG